MFKTNKNVFILLVLPSPSSFPIFVLIKVLHDVAVIRCCFR